MSFILFLINFILRLTPAYMMMVGIIQLYTFWYDKASPFYTYVRLHETCAKYWWTNLLYISNFYDYNKMVWKRACSSLFYQIIHILILYSWKYQDLIFIWLFCSFFLAVYVLELVPCQWYAILCSRRSLIDVVDYVSYAFEPILSHN